MHRAFEDREGTQDVEINTWDFPKIRVPYFGFLRIRIRLVRVLCVGPLFSETATYMERDMGSNVLCQQRRHRYMHICICIYVYILWPDFLLTGIQRRVGNPHEDLPPPPLSNKTADL